MVSESRKDFLQPGAADRVGRGVTQVEGRSMYPALHPGDEAIVEYGSGAIRLGDLVVFHDRDMLVIHRVIGVGATIRARGDALLLADGEIERDRILGRVRSVLRDGRELHLDTLRARVVMRAAGLVARLSEGRRWGYPLLRFLGRRLG